MVSSLGGNTSQYPENIRENVITTFRDRFGAQPTMIARAPGRINVIGEHTDYNEGFVLPAAIENAVYVAASPRTDNTVRMYSLSFDELATFTLDQLQDPDLPAWTRYPRGTMWVFEQEGVALRGMDLVIGSDVPMGAGFSSSAAVEVGMFESLDALHGVKHTQRDKALLGVRVEHKFIGIRSGAMDQMISALGVADHALLIDCRSYEAEPVPIPKGVTFVALDTGKRRELENTGYNDRRRDCEEAARLLGVASLRDVTPEQLAANLDKLPEIIERRAAHVVNENVRTLAAAEALNTGDLEQLGRLLNESHVSLRDLYEVSIRELDIMAELAQKEKGCYGARMMGGGFGGAVIALVADDVLPEFIQNMSLNYDAATHLKAYIHTTKAGAGSSLEKL
jgi:galactokinase